MFYDYSVLVIAEPDFAHKAVDQETYIERLKGVLKERAGEHKLRIVTVEGKYGIPSFEAQATDDKNKTAFVKSIEDYLSQINEVVIIANFTAEPFISAVSTRVGEAQKRTTVYGYKTRNEKP